MDSNSSYIASSPRNSCLHVNSYTWALECKITRFQIEGEEDELNCLLGERKERSSGGVSASY